MPAFFIHFFGIAFRNVTDRPSILSTMCPWMCTCIVLGFHMDGHISIIHALLSFIMVRIINICKLLRDIPTLVRGIMCSTKSLISLFLFALRCVFFLVLDNMGKPSGLGAGRKLANTRREQQWADKSYRRANSGSVYKVRRRRPIHSLLECLAPIMS